MSVASTAAMEHIELATTNADTTSYCIENIRHTSMFGCAQTNRAVRGCQGLSG